MKINFDKILTDCKDYHLPVGLFVFITGSIIHWFRGHLDASYTTFCGTVFAFLTGHSIFANRADNPTTTTTPPVGPTTGGPVAPNLNG